MVERRKSVRRQADRDLLQRLQTIQVEAERRGAGRDAEHARRRAIRHNCAATISMRIGHASGYSDTWEVASVRVKGRILDLSLTGASLFMGQSFDVGQELQLAVKLRDGSEIFTHASVRWVKHVPEKHAYTSGVQFIHVADKDQAKIRKFLQELDATLGL
jgi:c-di-GMP-binding flagellar brake protein YcgR